MVFSAKIVETRQPRTGDKHFITDRSFLLPHPGQKCQLLFVHRGEIGMSALGAAGKKPVADLQQQSFAKTGPRGDDRTNFRPATLSRLEFQEIVRAEQGD